jgi:hypothetical protein
MDGPCVGVEKEEATRRETTMGGDPLIENWRGGGFPRNIEGPSGVHCTPAVVAAVVQHFTYWNITLLSSIYFDCSRTSFVSFLSQTGLLGT